MVLGLHGALSAMTLIYAAPLHLFRTCHHHTACNVVQELGADETINYRKQDFADVYKDKPFDYIFDSVGGKAYFSTCMELGSLC